MFSVYISRSVKNMKRVMCRPLEIYHIESFFGHMEVDYGTEYVNGFCLDKTIELHMPGSTQEQHRICGQAAFHYTCSQGKDGQGPDENYFKFTRHTLFLQLIGEEREVFSMLLHS